MSKERGVLVEPDGALERRVLAGRPHKTLTSTQERVADLASRMILHGGDPEDIRILLIALARYESRIRCFNREEKELRERAMVTAARWQANLQQSWPKSNNQIAVSPELEATTVAEMVRADIRTRVRRHFEEFVSEKPGIEPIWLLNEILEITNSGEDMAKAIFYSLDDAGIYVRVPSQHEARVREFIALLDPESAN